MTLAEAAYSLAAKTPEPAGRHHAGEQALKDDMKTLEGRIVNPPEIDAFDPQKVAAQAQAYIYAAK